jgi:hypothetical protein
MIHTSSILSPLFRLAVFTFSQNFYEDTPSHFYYMYLRPSLDEQSVVPDRAKSCVYTKDRTIERDSGGGHNFLPPQLHILI